MSDDCVHGMNPDWCASCRRVDVDVPARGLGEYGYLKGQSKQDLLDRLCDQLGLPRTPVGRGSSLPSEVFEAAAHRFAVPSGSMPEIGEAVAERAGLPWGTNCDSRGSISGGGSTVTREGLEVLTRAVAMLSAGRRS